MKTGALGFALLIVLTAAVPCIAASTAPDRDQDPATRSVEALGAAPVADGDLVNARRNAIHHALSAAVEQVTGVYVTSSLQTRNYLVVEDKVTTRAAGFAILDQVLDERVEGGMFKVTVRATVSLGPLAARLGGLGPYRQWRVAVVMPAAPLAKLGCPRTEETTGEMAFADRLMDGDFLVTDWRHGQPAPTEAEVQNLMRATPEELAAWGRRHGADVVIAGPLAVQLDRVMPLTSDWLKIDYVHCRADATLRAVRTDTGEVLVSHVISGTDEATSRTTAVHALLERIGRRAGDRLMEPLLRLPGAPSATMRVSVAGFDRAFDGRRFQDLLAKMPGVRRVRFADYSFGRLTLDVTVPADRKDLLGALLEEPSLLAGFRIQVESQTRERVSARLAEDR